MPAIRLVADRYRADCACSVEKKKIFTLVHPWLQHPSTQQGCAKAAFHKVDDIAVGSAERADTQQEGRQAGREHTCTDESLDIIAYEASRSDS